MKKIIEGNERTWYLRKAFITESGLQARIIQCVWNDRIKKITSVLHDHFTGYVRLPIGDMTDYYRNSDLVDVHGGITYQHDDGGTKGIWVGFDMGHFGDENIPNPFEYCKEECEKLAKQIIKINLK